MHVLGVQSGNERESKFAQRNSLFIWNEIMRISALSGIQEFRPSPDR